MEYCSVGQTGTTASHSKGASSLSDSKVESHRQLTDYGRVRVGHTRSVLTQGTYSFCRGSTTSSTSTIATVDNVGQ